MTDPDTPDTTIDSFGDLPMQPTGSGAADLEIAYERMKLAQDGDAANLSTDGPGTVDDGSVMPAQTGDEAADSAAHPS